MTSMNCQIDDLDKVIKNILDEYGDEIKEVLDETTEKIAKKAKDEVKNNAPVGARKGKYKKSISVKKTKNTALEKEFTIYAKSPEYRLTHLLEKGHLIHNGTGRTKAYPHWSKGESYIAKNFQSEIEERIKNGR